MSNWTEKKVPSQLGRTVLITGANSGIGWDAARVLSGRGARVLLACRSERKGQEAIDRILALHPEADLAFLPLDLADLASVEAATDHIRESHDRIDLLINNAGVMATPLQRTAQGFEMQFGVNHLGHFALTVRLMPLLLRTAGARIVNVSSTAHRFGHMRFEDPQWEQDYRPWAAYGQSKLANLLFTYELARRLEGAGQGCAALAAHPGGSKTNLGHENPGGVLNTLLHLSRPLLERFLLQSSAMGALPTLRAAVDPDARSGEYYGPSGFNEQTGFPVRVDSNTRSKDVDAAQRLWQLSEGLTGEKLDLTTA